MFVYLANSINFFLISRTPPERLLSTSSGTRTTVWKLYILCLGRQIFIDGWWHCCVINKIFLSIPGFELRLIFLCAFLFYRVPLR